MLGPKCVQVPLYMYVDTRHGNMTSVHINNKIAMPKPHLVRLGELSIQVAIISYFLNFQSDSM